MSQENNSIWTIGHSTRSLEEFLTMLHSFNIELVADVRNFPGSRKYTHFNKESMGVTLTQSNIQYVHLKEPGRKKESKPRLKKHCMEKQWHFAVTPVTWKRIRSKKK